MGIISTRRFRTNEFEEENTDGVVLTLHQRVSRMRARWLKRVMYSGDVSSTEGCLAYAIFDHLNCVTLDSWPSQRKLAELLGFESVKTIQRAASGLEEKGFIRITAFRHNSHRYAPHFLLVDEDKIVFKERHSWVIDGDETVHESLLLTRLTPPTPTAAETTKQGYEAAVRNTRKHRGAYEIAVAEMLGPDGMEILHRLAKLDDIHVQRLCLAYGYGALGDRELAAARLAAEQSR
jgi:hypothetical protein